MRWIAAFAVTLGLLVTGAPTAQASTTGAPPVRSGPSAPSASSNPFGVPYCVSTTWRAHYWHTHKTPVRSYCFVPVDPTHAYKPAWWIPKAWTVRGYSSDDQTGEWGILVYTGKPTEGDK
jgi:hypothetical protein